ncbi:MAG: PKD domain-containing protein, partial [Methanospirillaceae archaeon]|nr:PKD domain-containing protein [Methanospirillaceae archaeon]
TAPLTVQFTDLSTGGPTMWAWDFGDGGTDMVADPLHTYTSPGIYTVTLTASSQYSGSDTQVKAGYITVDGGGGPTAAFSAEPTGGKSPLTVSFTDLSTGSPISWTWDFGDETGSSEQNPVHTYETANLYTVTLTVTNSQGADTLEMEDYISVSGDVPPPAAVFTADPRTGDAPLTVQFTDMSPGTPRWWLWKFGDGDSSTEKNPVHTYSQTGSYDVYLKVGNSGGADSTLMPGFITVTGTGTIVADFSGTPVYGEKPLTVQFTDLSTGGPTMWAWDFGDGGTDMIADPLHTYTEAGIYSVTLTASSQYGSDTITKTGYITVIEQGGIVADFSGTPTCGEKPLTVQFTDLSTGSPTMWAWDFGDGGTAMVADPHYTYTEAGIYTVTLTASSQITGTDTIVKAGYITVTEQGGIVADFSGSPTTGEAPLTVQFTDTSTGTPTMWAWNFGDGGTAMVANPAHTYTGEGVYTVSLTASSQITGTDTIVKPGYITVTKPGSEGVISVSSTPGGAEVYIDDEYIGITPVTKTGLSYGAHRVRISLEGYKPWEKTVYPLPGKPVEIQAVLEPSGHETGSINIQLAPQWSTVYLNGLEQGQTKQSVPFILSNLQEGTYEIKVTRPGFEDYQNRVPVYSGQTTKIYVRMTQKPGSEPGIMIDSIPRGGAVTVDGSAVGTTPLVVPGISKGEHTVKVTMDGYFDWQQGVTVTSGKTSYVTAVLYPEFWSPSAGYMMVTSLPGTATLSVDGVLAGQSPMTLSAVSPGDHLVRLELESYEPWEQMVTVREGKTSYVIARMTQ